MTFMKIIELMNKARQKSFIGDYNSAKSLFNEALKEIQVCQDTYKGEYQLQKNLERKHDEVMKE